jgi:hypothetical protein
METRHEAVDEDIPTIDDVICYLRWKHPEMVETLDDRMKHQHEMVLEILMKKGVSPRDLMRMTPGEANALDDLELRLCYHVLRDIAYIDSLR